MQSIPAVQQRKKYQYIYTIYPTKIQVFLESKIDFKLKHKERKTTIILSKTSPSPENKLQYFMIGVFVFFQEFVTIEFRPSKIPSSLTFIFSIGILLSLKHLLGYATSDALEGSKPSSEIFVYKLTKFDLQILLEETLRNHALI